MISDLLDNKLDFDLSFTTSEKTEEIEAKIQFERKKFDSYSINKKTPDGRDITISVQPLHYDRPKTKTGYCRDSSLTITIHGPAVDTVTYITTGENYNSIMIFNIPKDSTGKRLNGTLIGGEPMR